MKDDPLVVLLNKCHALIDSEFTSINECAEGISETPQRVSEWITQRAHRPSGCVALKLMAWAAKKMHRIATKDDKHHLIMFRVAYAEISERFPGGGKRVSKNLIDPEKSLQAAYIKAYREVCRRRSPVAGKGN